MLVGDRFQKGVFQLHQRLTDRQLGLDEGKALLDELRLCSHSSDPIERTAARQVRIASSELYQLYQDEEYRLQGKFSGELLDQHFGSIQRSVRDLYETTFSEGPFTNRFGVVTSQLTLPRLLEKAATEPVQPHRLRQFAVLAREFTQRAGRDVKDRSVETPELDHKLAKGFADQASAWWNDGRIRVELDGREVKPGTWDLGQALTTSIPAVDGLTLSFVTPSQRAPEDVALATSILEQVRPDVSTGRPEPWIAQLAGLPPEQGARVFQAMLDQTELEKGDADKLRKLETVLRKKDLQPLVLTGLDRMLDQGRDAALRGTVSPGGHWPGQCRLALYAQLLPHARVDDKLLREQLGPFVKGSDFSVASEALKLVRAEVEKQPALVGTAMELAFEAHESDEVKSLRNRCLELGWLPDHEQLSAMMAGLVQLPGTQGNTALNNREFTTSIEFLGQLPPSMTAGLTLPGPDGSMIPMGRAILERLASEWTDAAASRTALQPGETRENSWRGKLFALIGPQPPEMADALLDRVEKPADRSDNYARDLGLLSGMKLTPSQLDRLGGLFRDELLRGENANRKLGVQEVNLRRHLVERELAAPGPNRMGTLSELVRLELYGSAPAEYEKLCEGLLGGLSSGQRRQTARTLIQQLSEVLPGGLGGLKPEQAGDLVAMEYLTRGEPDLRGEAMALTRELKVGNYQPNVRALVLPWQRERWSDCNAALSQGSGTPAETYAPFLESWQLVQGVPDLDRKWETAVASWREGLPPEVAASLRGFGENDVGAFSTLAQCPTWSDLIGRAGELSQVAARLGPEAQFSEVTGLYNSARELCDSGMRFDHALDTAYARLKGLPAPSLAGTGLREEEDHVAVGSIRLRRRRT